MMSQKKHIPFWLSDQIAILCTFFVAKITNAHFFVANTINAHFLLQKWFEHTCFVAKTIYTHFFCHKNYLYTFFVTKRIYAHFFCRENDLRTSSGKFLRVESCHPESLDFLGLWLADMVVEMCNSAEIVEEIVDAVATEAFNNK